MVVSRVLYKFCADDGFGEGKKRKADKGEKHCNMIISITSFHYSKTLKTSNDRQVNEDETIKYTCQNMLT